MNTQKRYYFSLILSGLILFLTSCKEQKEVIVPKQPNILFILADDYGYHDLSSAGSDFYETPNIDRISREGMTFTNGYATCQVCSPSRASIMSGKFPARHGITDWIGARTETEWRKVGRFNKLLPPAYERGLSHDFITLPEAMKANGYKTFFAGKWHLGEKGSWPEDHGFDINKGGWDAGSPNGGYFSPYKNPNLENKEDGENLSMRLAKETVQFLKDNNPNTTGRQYLLSYLFTPYMAQYKPLKLNGRNTDKKPWI